MLQSTQNDSVIQSPDEFSVLRERLLSLQLDGVDNQTWVSHSAMTQLIRNLATSSSELTKEINSVGRFNRIYSETDCTSGPVAIQSMYDNCFAEF